MGTIHEIGLRGLIPQFISGKDKVVVVLTRHGKWIYLRTLQTK
jgi:hypothetical protein